MTSKRPVYFDAHRTEILASLARGESLRSIARRLNTTHGGVQFAVARWEREGFDASQYADVELPDQPTQAGTVDIDKLAGMIGKRPVSVEQLADELNVSPRHIREGIATLQASGYRVTEAAASEITLEKVPQATATVTRSLLDGDEITVGIVSDTHLGSREEALEHLHAFYDEAAARGISEIWHAGDLVAGVGIYRGQEAWGLLPGLNTYRTQVDYAVENYPKRDGITTLMISGNHDVEGAAGRIGADPVSAVSHQRADIKHIGVYSGSIELPNGAHAQLVHGRGGGSYAVSYKAQKYVESLPPGRKPALLIFGHWHISGWFRHRSVPILMAGCWEWQTDLLVRLGLQPDVGGWFVTLRLADDGSIVGMIPEWVGFYPGRTEQHTSSLAMAH